LAKASIEFAKMGFASAENAEQLVGLGTAAVMLAQQVDKSIPEAALMIGRLAVYLRVDAAEAVTMAGTMAKIGFAVRGTADDVYRATERFGAFARTLGMSAPEVLALASMVRDSGLQIRRGSTAINRTLQQMAMQTTTFGRIVQSQGGPAVSEFVQTFQTNPLKAFQMVMEAVNKTSGAQAVQMLRSTGLVGTYISDIITLSGNMNKMDKVLELANAETASGTQLQSGFATMMSTTTAQIDILKDSLRTFGIAVGAYMLPFIKGAAFLLSKVVQALIWIGDKAPFLYWVVGGFLAIVAATYLATKVYIMYITVAALMKMANIAVTVTVWGLTKAIGALTWKITKALLLVMALIAFISWVTGWDIGSAIGKGISSSMAGVSSEIDKVMKDLSGNEFTLPVKAKLTPGATKGAALEVGAPAVPSFQHGGPVTGLRPQLAVLHPGEFVLPTRSVTERAERATTSPEATRPVIRETIIKTIQVPITVTLDGSVIARYVESVNTEKALRAGGKSS
jgi:TP901 family phage tail tape measure protein